MPETEAADKLLLSALIPYGSPSVYFRSTSMFPPDRFPEILNPQVFCLLTLAVQYQSLEREAPQGGLNTLPVKRFREANL